ncbi:MAG TPA: PAS domain S-box protein [Thermoanaerobaculia bacterium]|nr:PAS domain S-box protein [Thermoanaerobaculia bacterium]
MARLLTDLLLRELPDAVTITTPAGEIVYWNSGAERLFGHLAADAIGSSIDALIVPPGHVDDLDQFRREALTTGFSTFETARLRKDGSLIYTVVSNKAIYDAEGRAEFIVITQKDVTHLKVLRDAKLVESQFRDLLESTPDAIIMANQTGRIVLANSQAETLFGYERGELLGTLVEVLLPSRYRGGHVSHRSGYFHQPRTRSMGAGLELFGLRKDGSEFPVEISLSPLKTDGGTLVMSAIRDITSRKGIERALQEKNVELERANQAKDRFLASMSHELRTPLNGIIGFAEFLSDGKPGPLNDKQKEYLGDILNSGRHLLHLINDMLDLVKIQAGRVDLTLERFSIRDAISEVCTGVHPLAVSKAIELTVNLADGIELVTLDQQRFKQILYNLLSNALKFTDEQGHIGIDVTLLDGGRFRLVVSDDGIGIRAEDIGRLFTEFEQLDSGTARRFGGTGLGLALTRSLVTLHKGVVEVESEFGKGSTFRVILPLVVAGEKAKASA